MPAKAGIQNYLKILDSRLRGNDAKGGFKTFYETIDLQFSASGGSGFSLKRLRVHIRYMTLPAITPRRMLHPKGRHRPRTHVACNAIASHLQLMGNGRWRPGQFGSAQTGGHNAHPIAVSKHLGLGHRDVTLPAGDLLRMGRYGRISF